MRFAILALLMSISACANHGQPDYCSEQFDADDIRWDLNHDGQVTGTDFVEYLHRCTE